jgi:hypothetical protein
MVMNKWQTPEVANVPSSAVDQLDNASEVSSKPKVQFSYASEEKSSEDKKIDTFLNEVNEVHKKRASEVVLLAVNSWKSKNQVIIMVVNQNYHLLANHNNVLVFTANLQLMFIILQPLRL